MTFTSTLPTIPGDYAWKESAEHLCHSLVQVTKVCGPGGCGLRVQAGDPYGRDMDEMGGVWCRLLSVDELAAAYKEGFLDRHVDVDPYPTPGWATDRWNRSHSKRIAEGLE